MTAFIGLGYAHLAKSDAAAAADAFRRALEIRPSDGHALLGLQRAEACLGHTSEAELLAQRVQASI